MIPRPLTYRPRAGPELRVQRCRDFSLSAGPTKPKIRADAQKACFSEEGWTLVVSSIK